MRKRRRALSHEQQISAAQALKRALIKHELCEQANKIALYLANDAEIDPHPFIHWCWQQGKQVFLPVIHPFCPSDLLFIEYAPTTLMTTNRFAIVEPKLDVRHVCPVAQLDVICTPLVAFDKKGGRLGMGGGFYDPSLASCKSVDKAASGPHLIGLAHDCQLVESLAIASWDVAMSCIITPQKRYLD